MAPTILYDGFNLSLSTGTGISTYTRNLTRAARDAGYRTSIAYSIADPLPADSVLREVMLFEGRKPRAHGIERNVALVKDWTRTRLGLFGTLPLVEATPVGAVETGPLKSSLPEFDDLHVGQLVYQRARLHFSAKGRMANLALARPPDIAHFTFSTPLRMPGAANVYTIHDLVPLRLPYTTLHRKDYFHSLHREIARTADHIVTVSDASRQDIVRWLDVAEDRVTNTYQAIAVPEGLAAKSRDVVADELGGLYGLDYGRYFLFFGAIEPKKNVARLLQAFLSSGLDLPLVIVSSSGWQNDAELEIMANKWFQRRGLGGRPRRPKLRPISYAPYELLVSLIRGARAVTFPSLYEGFGLPVLEAMLLGTPVLTSNVSSLPEVAGDAALYVDPTDVESIRQGLRTLARDDDLCRDLSARGVARAELFSPARYRDRVAALYAKLGFAADPVASGPA